jgi:recombination protein RecR
VNSSPKLLQNLIDHFGRLPGIGPKSAARIAFYILNIPIDLAEDFANTIIDVKKKIQFCKYCKNISENEVCSICADDSRDKTEIIVVEDVLGLMAFERISEYRGLYHVLGGVISPVNGIGPEEINIAGLFSRLKNTHKEVKEIVVATNPNLEGEATAMYLKQELSHLYPKIIVTRIARGVPSGADLDYTDKITLSRALSGRTSL